MHRIYEISPALIPINVVLAIVYLSITGIVFFPLAMYVFASKPTQVMIDLVRWWFDKDYKHNRKFNT